ncbi:MAG: L-histidine N(alpha)-methyltransferase [Casimicrobiaceae bacterium]|nr:L-histidine N(alpha)-methyltransferase [Casimicrobiaceae bacterium]
MSDLTELRARPPGARSETASRPYLLINALCLDAREQRERIARGLLAAQAALPPNLFYDALGSSLYEAIVLTEEYYLTRTENALFEAHCGEIARLIGPGKQFVDLGSGDSAKAERWFETLAPVRYVAVDICEPALTAALMRLARRPGHPELVGLLTDFSHALDLHAALAPLPSVFFYPGSSIGNFTPEEALHFLRQIRAHCTAPGSGLLIGVDLVKDVARLERAYDDALGVTAAFNLNILRHVNRLLEADFDVRDWKHVAFFNRAESRIEMHLEARRDLEVRIGSQHRRFARGERIHTENSYKYEPQAFEALVREAGFSTLHRWTDPAQDFLVVWAEV